MEKCGFKQIRFIEWIKTNPQPLNSKVNYLTNCREIALLGIKKSKPTFNSKYDNGLYDNEIYQFPVSWLHTGYNMIRYNRYDVGGHFAAFETPETLAKDSKFS